MDLFIFHYITMSGGKEVSIGRLYQEFVGWWQKKTRDVEEELIFLKAYSKKFESFYHPDLKTRTGVFEHRLHIMDYTTIYPLFLYLLEARKSEISPEDLDGIITDLESFLVRRLVCDLSNKNYNKLFLSLLANLHEAASIDRKLFQRLLLQSQSETNRWPNDYEFEQNWLSLGHRFVSLCD
jgi:hypothetical protein